jgi:hypothetical protein
MLSESSDDGDQQYDQQHTDGDQEHTGDDDDDDDDAISIKESFVFGSIKLVYSRSLFPNIFRMGTIQISIGCPFLSWT